MQDEAVESEVRDHGEWMQQLYFFSFRFGKDAEIVYFISYFYASGESVSRRCRPKSSTFEEFVENIRVSESELWRRRAKDITTGEETLDPWSPFRLVPCRG